MKTIFFTTSWDDGHPLDKKLVNLLLKYNIKSTFYITPQNKERPFLKSIEIKKFSNFGFEIGSHTLTHPEINKISKEKLIYELLESKKILENIIKKPVYSFAYPKGKTNSEIPFLLKKYGYKLGRTTVLFQFSFSKNFNQYLMPISIHFSKRSYFSYIKQIFRENNIFGLAKWFFYLDLETDPFFLSLKALNYLKKNGGVFHIFGHSWEIEKYNLWSKLEKIFIEINKYSYILKLTNFELLKYLK